MADELTPVQQNEWFASKHAFNYHRCSRRDDIIQLIYVLLFLHTRLYSIRDEAPTADVIGNFKKKATAARMCDGTPFEPLLAEAYSYSYDEDPDYGKLIFLMKNILYEKKIPFYHKFQWEEEK